MKVKSDVVPVARVGAGACEHASRRVSHGVMQRAERAQVLKLERQSFTIALPRRRTVHITHEVIVSIHMFIWSQHGLLHTLLGDPLSTLCHAGSHSQRSASRGKEILDAHFFWHFFPQ